MVSLPLPQCTRPDAIAGIGTHCSVCIFPLYGQNPDRPTAISELTRRRHRRQEIFGVDSAERFANRRDVAPAFCLKLFFPYQKSTLFSLFLLHVF